MVGGFRCYRLRVKGLQELCLDQGWVLLGKHQGRFGDSGLCLFAVLVVTPVVGNDQVSFADRGLEFGSERGRSGD